MEAALTVPNADLVREACEKFDSDNSVTEKALADLFAAYPANDNPSHVLLKVVALNSLYSTRILAVLKLAHRIAEQGAAVDAALAAGSAEAVDTVARVSLEDKDYIYYSFASKYCNWHQPNLYPIYDSRVDKYLWFLKKHDLFQPEAFSQREDMHRYPQFCVVMNAFRDQFGLGEFTFKQIDNFLWSQGESIWAVSEEEAREAAAVFEEPPPEPEPAPVNAFGEPQVESAEAPAEPLAQASEAQAPAPQEVPVPANEPEPTPVKQRGGGLKLFLDMFSAGPRKAEGEQPNGQKPQ